MKIFLVGYMGSGKSKVGMQLARLLDYSFSDTDQLVEKTAGMSVSEIFSESGEQHFRELETKTLRSLAGLDKFVVATGGGLPAFDQNMDWMNRHGLTVYLEARPGMLYQRLIHARAGRPLIKKLSETDLMEQIHRHLELRDPFYRQATIVVEAGDIDVKKLAEQIREKKFLS